MTLHRQEKNLNITERATEWLEMIDDATPQERAAFIAWLKESPRHVGEFLAVAAVYREFNGFDPARQIDVDALIEKSSSNVVALGEEKENVSAAVKRPSRRWVVG